MLIAKGAALRELGDPDLAVATIRDAMRLKPDLTWVRRSLVGTLLAANREDEARAEMKLLFDSHPSLTPERFVKSSPRAIRTHGQAYLDRFLQLGFMSKE